MAKPHRKSDVVGHPGSRGWAASKALQGEDLRVTKPRSRLHVSQSDTWHLFLDDTKQCVRCLMHSRATVDTRDLGLGPVKPSLNYVPFEMASPGALN